MIVQSLKSRENNIILIKLLSAMVVIGGHAKPLLYGSGAYETTIISRAFAGYGGFAVSIFFFLGGMLNCRSVIVCNSAYAFLTKWLKRLLPTLIVVSTCLALGIGPLISECDLRQYYSDNRTWLYLLNGIMIIRHDLPGVFVNNPYSSTVNGVLWTMPVEFICYILCYIAKKLGLLERKKMLILLPFITVMYYMGRYIMGEMSSILGAVCKPVFMFWIGMLCYMWRDYISVKTIPAFGCLILLIATNIFGYFDYIGIWILPYVLIYFAFGIRYINKWLVAKYDISYEMYLVAWPIQQMLSSYWGIRIPVQIHIIAVSIISIAVAIVIKQICGLWKRYLGL